MNNEKWTIKLNGRNSGLIGNKRGNEINDLDKIASEIGASKAEILNGDIIKDIHIEKIKVRHGNYIDAIQFSYKVTTNDKTYSIEGNKHGGNGGRETIIHLETDEYLLRVEGKRDEVNGHGNVDELNFTTYIPSRKQIKFYGNYGGKWNTAPFRMSPAAGTIYACFFGKSTDYSLTSFGMHEGRILSSNHLEQQIKQLQIQLTESQTNNQNLQQKNTQLVSQIQQKNQELEKLRQENQQVQQLFNLLFPNQPYNFNQLKQETTCLKHQEMAPHVRGEKAKFEQLITNAKNKVGNLEKIVDLLLETQKHISENEQSNDQLSKVRLEGQLTAYQNILEGNLAKQELKALLSKQTELHQLEKHLASLQQNQGQVAQIQQNYPFKK